MDIEILVRLTSFLFVFVCLLTFLLIGNLIYLGKYVNKLEDLPSMLSSNTNRLENEVEHIHRMYKWHEEDVKKIQAEVLARDILDDKADIDDNPSVLLNSRW